MYNHYFTISFIILLILNSISIAAPESSKNKCTNFDQIALQLALAQNNTQPPLELNQIQLALGVISPESILTVTSYSWVYKNRILLVTINGNDISNKMLTGNDDGSVISKKMEQIYSNLKSATSIWSIKEIQNQLGPGYIKNSKLLKYNWHCGNGSLAITTNNDNIVSATINYNTTLDLIESRVGLNHPEWDIKTDSLGQSNRTWQRSFAK